VIAYLLVPASLVLAPPPGGHHREHPSLVGAKYGQRLRWGDEEGVGVTTVVGPLVERVIVHRRLELELEVPISIGHRGELVVPIGLHFKRPFHPSPRWSPYIGLGPTVELGIRPRRRVAVGISTVAGSYLWLSPRLGFDVDIAFDVALERGSSTLALAVAVGPVWRFGAPM
jgi:hypothetical protein